MSAEDWIFEDPFDERWQDGGWEGHPSTWHDGGQASRYQKVEMVTIRIADQLHETAKAVLLDVCMKDSSPIQVWFPKYCLGRRDNRKVEVRGDFWKRKQKEVANAHHLDPDTIGVWEKRRKKGEKPKRKKGMQSKQLVHLIQQGYTTVSVCFDHSGGNRDTYTYKTNLDLEPDDIVVVPARGYFKTAQVIEVHEEPQIDLDSDIDYKWVVQKVDVKGWQELNAKEDALAKKIVNFEHKQRRTALLASLGISSENSELLSLTQMGGTDAIEAPKKESGS